MELDESKWGWGQVSGYGSNNLPILPKGLKPSIGRFHINNRGSLMFECCRQAWIDGSSFSDLKGSLFIALDTDASFFIPYEDDKDHRCPFEGRQSSKISVKFPLKGFPKSPPEKDQINSITKMIWNISPNDWGECCFPQPYECQKVNQDKEGNLFKVNTTRGTEWLKEYLPERVWENGEVILRNDVRSYVSNFSSAKIEICASYNLEISFITPITILQSADVYQLLSFVFEYFLGQKSFLAHPDIIYGDKNEHGTLFMETFHLRKPHRCWKLLISPDDLGYTYRVRASTLQYSWEKFASSFTKTLEKVWNWVNDPKSAEYSVLILLFESVSSKSDNETEYETITRYYSVFERISKRGKGSITTTGKAHLDEVEKLFKSIPEYAHSFNQNLTLNEWWKTYISDCRKSIAHGSRHDLKVLDPYIRIDISHLAELVLFLIVSKEMGIPDEACHDLAKRALRDNTVFDVGLGVKSGYRRKSA